MVTWRSDDGGGPPRDAAGAVADSCGSRGGPIDLSHQRVDRLGPRPARASIKYGTRQWRIIRTSLGDRARRAPPSGGRPAGLNQ